MNEKSNPLAIFIGTSAPPSWVRAALFTLRDMRKNQIALATYCDRGLATLYLLEALTTKADTWWPLINAEVNAPIWEIRIILQRMIAVLDPIRRGSAVDGDALAAVLAKVDSLIPSKAQQ